MVRQQVRVGMVREGSCDTRRGFREARRDTRKVVLGAPRHLSLPRCGFQRCDQREREWQFGNPNEVQHYEVENAASQRTLLLVYRSL